MVVRLFSCVAILTAALWLQACGSEQKQEPRAEQAAARVPEMTIELYDGIGNGNGMRLAASEPSNDCKNRSPNLGAPNGNPNEDQICTLPPRPITEAVNPDCPCNAECLEPYFDHNKNRGPEGTIQMYTPPASRRYYPGVPSAKHWENGVEQNIFAFDIQLTNFYKKNLKNVYIVLVKIAPDGSEVGSLREGFQDSRPHACLNNQFAVWSFGEIDAGETVSRTVMLRLPNDEAFTITGFVVSLTGKDCEAGLRDADGDNLSDAEEFALGTDANDPDTDGDGLFDGSEDNSGVFVSFWHTGTDPLNRDTDGDCFGDGTELAENFDPLNGADHPSRQCSPADLKNPNP